ncbi:MAG: YggS family pyridoxal phosphate-dependent enzyme [Bacteroidetes bacterium]|nr:YggS family pyridoxal phosphate-dependent enzyme [Bacteroidota bacterium]
MVIERIRHIEERIQHACVRSGRTREDLTLVVVTKTQDAERINEALAAGLPDIGENRVQEYLAKHDALLPHRFHMIGHLQRNKVRQIINDVFLIHSVDSIPLAEEIERLAAISGREVDVLLEVNSSGEESKFGVAPEDVPVLAEALLRLSHVRLRGLMTVAAFVEDAATLRPAFRRLRELRDELAARHPDAGIRELSMGMTNDFEIAIEEGATLIRLGSAIFGPRA